MRCDPLWTRLQPWIRDYDRLQWMAVLLIYIQIGCALVGSIGALYNGVMLINVAVTLFALVAIESANQRLGRTYAILLACTMFLDIVWLILFSMISGTFRLKIMEHMSSFLSESLWQCNESVYM
ncbi:hypothetical protein QQ045_025428 [Rhodiola kirilowii]